MNEKKRQILEKVQEVLRDALIAHDVTEDSVIKVFSQILFDKNARDADRLRAVEIFSKFAGLAAPETKIHKFEGIKVEEPEDVDI